MCACPRARCLSAFEIDAIIFTFFFRVPNEKRSLSLSLAHHVSSLFFAAGKKKRMRHKKEHTENKHKR